MTASGEKDSDPREILQRAFEAQLRRDLDAASRYCNAVLDRCPNDVEALHLSAMLAHQRGDNAQALRVLDRALALEPKSAAIVSNRASVKLALRDLSGAEHDAERAAELNPKLFGAWFNLGLALRGQSRHAGAASAFARASALRPTHARALLEWFSTAAMSAQTFGIPQRVREGLPSLAGERDLSLRTATRLEEHGRALAAFAVLSRLAGELPDDARVRARLKIEAAYGAAARLEQEQRNDAALAAVDALLQRAPKHRGARMLRASLVAGRGDAGTAMSEYRRIVAQVPDDPVAASAMLIAMQYDPRCSAADVFAAHRDWSATHMPDIAPPWAARLPHADPDRPLRIGWLSPRFFSGLVADFFLGPLQKMDRDGMFHVLYDTAGVNDATTIEFRNASNVWRNVEALDDNALCEQIRADGIDILVELSGHSPGNRLRALAARPAPVQISWLDYFHSTGTKAVDFIFSDAVLSPPELDKYYTERVVHLPSGRLCHKPSQKQFPAKARAPDRVRFASFSRISKINDEVLHCWSRILAGVPKSLLKVKARAFDSADDRAYFLQRCAGFGIETHRVELIGHSSAAETLAAYGDVDIALDTFPFSGCATSFDALGEGVPVITLVAQTMVSRQTASLLTALNLTECIAMDVDDYVMRATALAFDAVRREQLRQCLSERTRERLCRTDVHAQELSDALRHAWRLFCGGALAGSAN